MNLPWPAAGIRGEYACVDAQYGDEHAEQRDRRELAHKLDSDEDADEHEEKKGGAVDTVRVIRVLRDVNRADYV